MDDQLEWRRLEKEFRDFQGRHPNLYAAMSMKDGQWSGFGGPDGEQDRFRTLLGLAAATAGHAGEDAIDDLLNLVLEYQQQRESEHLSVGKHAQLPNQSTGVMSPPGSIPPPAQNSDTFFIRPLCTALADFCLERERHALSAQVKPKSPRRRGRPPISPKLKEKALALKQQPGTTNTDLAKILYETRHPTPAQVKNVYSILNYYLKALDKTKKS